MSNNSRKSDREKVLEDILKSVDKGTLPDTGKSRAERAAASSANRAASERISERTVYRNSSEPYKAPSSVKKDSSRSVYSRLTNAKKNVSAGRTVSTSRGSMPDERTENISRSSMSDEHTESTGIIGEYGQDSLDAVEFSGSLNRLIDTFDETSSGTSNKTDKVRNNVRKDTVASPHRNIGARAVKGSGKKRNGVRRKRIRFSGRLQKVIIVTVLIFTVAISLATAIISVGKDMLAIGKSDDIKIVTIPEGVTTEEVAQILYDEGIIKMPSAFKFVSKLSGAENKYIAGDHELSPSNAYETIINELTTDKSLEMETVDVTFVEGCDVISAGKQLEEAGVCEAERFVYYFNAGDYNFEFEKYLPSSTSSKFNRMEGYLFPDTYTFYVNTDPEVVCQKIYKNFDEKFKPEYYEKLKELNMTLDETITLASIVQAESPDMETMKKVASVFENRLANPEEYPKLQSDPTRYYVEEVIKPNIEIPSKAIFEAYDTYESNGLPPGAIGNPGTAAIEAVLYPADTDYYFFYANVDTKETFFAETDEEHEQNKEMVSKQQSGDDEGNEDEE